MKIEKYFKQHPTDSNVMIGLLTLALVDGWNREYDPEHINKVNKIFESYLSMRDAQIKFAESLCTSKDGDKCKANCGAPCAYQCISKWYETYPLYSWSCESI